MSSSKECYIGAYLLVPFVPKTATASKIVCPAACILKHCFVEDKFCYQCGAPLQQVIDSKTELVRIRQFDQPEGFEDYFSLLTLETTTNFSVWLPNKREGGGVYLNRGEEMTVESILSLGDDFVNRAREKFLAYYIPAITALEAKFDIKVELRVGVVSYWN